MSLLSSVEDLPTAFQLVGTLCQMGTAVIAAGIGVVTFRYTKRQSALSLINQNNTLANLVNQTLINSEDARDTLGKLHDFIVGCPDDAVLFMYLNYVHNTYRMHQIGAVSLQVWRDTLAACGNMVGRLRREQLELLLSRGYEARFGAAVLARYDEMAPTRNTEALATIRPRRKTPRELSVA
ncbi:MAG: hypothetical protein JOZ05_21115 [Acetobacteraceae bacterium]|nr:hypothetical protein [Acetobacteraceae bacterium]